MSEIPIAEDLRTTYITAASSEVRSLIERTSLAEAQLAATVSEMSENEVQEWLEVDDLRLQLAAEQAKVKVLREALEGIKECYSLGTIWTDAEAALESTKEKP